MASISIGPGGTSVQGQHQCSNNNLLGDQGNPLGALIDTLTEQRITGMTQMRYPSMAEAIDMHMPMRAATSPRVDGNKTYKTSVGYNGLLNSDGVKNITPGSGNYNNPVSLLTSCGDLRSKDIASSANTNAEACNPIIDGPMPIVGREEFGRQAFVTRLPIPPLCFADYTNKENFLMHLRAILSSVDNGTTARFAADQLRWVISKTRFNGAPVQVSQGNGKAKLPVSDALFTSFTYGRVPQHYGSADWMAGMLRLSEIDPRQDLIVDLPTAIFRKYKEQLISDIGINIYENSKNLTNAVNGFIRNIQEETLIYQDEIYGRRITFRATTKPVYVEVEETSTGGGAWTFQEPWIHRDSETAGQVMARHNPNWGVACSCANRTLAAIVMVSADNARPFYKEPLPNDNPASGLNALINEYAAGQGSKVNTTLAQMYPSSVETVIFTGVEAQVFMLDKINQRFREAGYGCDVASNIENTWIAGYTKIAAQFVEEDPRALVSFMLRMPNTSNCVDLVVACENNEDTIDEAGAFDPETFAPIKQAVPLPEPVEPDEPSAGAAYVIGKSTTIVAPCTGTRTVSIKFRRSGGTAGAITVDVAGTPSAHSGSVPGTVEFADGETEATLEFDVNAWACENPEQETETFVLTFSGDLTEDAITTRRICIKCNKACPAECEGDVGGCASC